MNFSADGIPFQFQDAACCPHGPGQFIARGDAGHDLPTRVAGNNHQASRALIMAALCCHLSVFFLLSVAIDGAFAVALQLAGVPPPLVFFLVIRRPPRSTLFPYTTLLTDQLSLM